MVEFTQFLFCSLHNGENYFVFFLTQKNKLRWSRRNERLFHLLQTDTGEVVYN